MNKSINRIITLTSRNIKELIREPLSLIFTLVSNFSFSIKYVCSSILDVLKVWLFLFVLLRLLLIMSILFCIFVLKILVLYY